MSPPETTASAEVQPLQGLGCPTKGSAVTAVQGSQTPGLAPQPMQFNAAQAALQALLGLPTQPLNLSNGHSHGLHAASLPDGKLAPSDGGVDGVVMLQLLRSFARQDGKSLAPGIGGRASSGLPVGFSGQQQQQTLAFLASTPQPRCEPLSEGHGSGATDSAALGLGAKAAGDMAAPLFDESLLMCNVDMADALGDLSAWAMELDGDGGCGSGALQPGLHGLGAMGGGAGFGASPVCVFPPGTPSDSHGSQQQRGPPSTPHTTTPASGGSRAKSGGGKGGRRPKTQLKPPRSAPRLSAHAATEVVRQTVATKDREDEQQQAVAEEIRAHIVVLQQLRMRYNRLLEKRAGMANVGPQLQEPGLQADAM